MPFNGSGLFTRGFNWVSDKLAGIDITASRMDSDSNDFASGLSNCVTRDGQGQMTSDLLPGLGNLNLGSAGSPWATLNGVAIRNYLDQKAFQSSTFDVANNSTLTNDTQLQLSLLAGRYAILAQLDVTLDAASGQGAKFNLNYNAAFSSLSQYMVLQPGIVPNQGAFSTTVAGGGFNLGTIGVAPNVTTVIVIGAFQATASGLLTVGFAQQVSNANGSAIQPPSYLSARYLGG